MTTSRRRFVEAGLLGGMSAALPASSPGAEARPSAPGQPNPRYAKLDEILRQPVLKRELFPAPVVIETLELLRLGDSFLCRVRSRDGAEGLSVGHSGLKVLYPLFVHNLQPFFVGKDARDLDLLLERVFVYSFNFRYNGISIGTPLATIELAILDLLGRIAGKPFGQLVGDVHHPEVSVYQATEYREKPVEESLELIRRDVAEYDARALKIKVGGLMFMTTDPRAAGPPGPDRGDHPARPEDVRGRDGPLRRRQRVLLGGRGDPGRPPAGGAPVRLLRGAGDVRLVRGDP